MRTPAPVWAPDAVWPPPGCTHPGARLRDARRSARRGSWTRWLTDLESGWAILIVHDDPDGELWSLGCLRCGMESPRWVPETAPLGVRLLPRGVVSEREPDSSVTPVCAVTGCGATEDLQVHHWAPRARFTRAFARERLVPAWDHWPTSLLCRDHHIAWHARMSGYRFRSLRRDQSLLRNRAARLRGEGETT